MELSEPSEKIYLALPGISPPGFIFFILQALGIRLRFLGHRRRGQRVVSSSLPSREPSLRAFGTANAKIGLGVWTIGATKRLIGTVQ